MTRDEEDEIFGSKLARAGSLAVIMAGIKVSQIKIENQPPLPKVFRSKGGELLGTILLCVVLWCIYWGFVAAVRGIFGGRRRHVRLPAAYRDYHVP